VHRAKGTCANGTLIRRSEIEARLLAGIKEKLLAPDLVAAFITAFQAEVNRTARDSEARQAAARGELAAFERKIERLVAAIEDGLYDPSVKARLDALQLHKAAIKQEIDKQPAASALRLHPNLAELYRQKVASLEEALNAPNTRAEASEVMRGLIETIVLTSREGEPISAELNGDLAAILAFRNGEEGRPKANRPPLGSDGRFSVVAGAGFEPTTFRL
jgi:site-specific DNA recombinase